MAHKPLPQFPPALSTGQPIRCRWLDLRDFRQRRVELLAAPPFGTLFEIFNRHQGSQFLRNSGIEMDGGWHVITNIRMETNVPGVFVAGDVRVHSDRQLGTAVGDGITAALAAYHYITNA